MIAAICILMSLLSFPVFAQDADNDGVSDALEAKLGMDPTHADTFELLIDDKAKGEGDQSIGRDVEVAGDFTTVSVCAAAKDRYVWRVEFTKPWEEISSAATILYVDADNNRDTGRQDKAFAQGVDMMLRPDGASMFDWPAIVVTASASEGNVLYMVADIGLNQQDGKSVYRCMMLTQDIREGREQDRDSSVFAQVSASGRSDRERIDVAPGHLLYHPPEVIENVAARMVPGAATPTAQITWTTTWPCNSHVEYGPTSDMDLEVEDEPGMQNHRVYIPVAEGADYRYRVVCISSDGGLKTSETQAFKADIPQRQGDVKRGRIPLSIAGAPGTDPDTQWKDVPQLESAPHITGIPFPDGALGSVRNLRLMRGDTEIPLQAECASRWPDGSVKWALIQFQTGVSVDPLADIALEYGSEVLPSVELPAPMVKAEGALLFCNTGPLEALIDTKSFDLFTELSLDRNGDGQFSADEQLIRDPGEEGCYLVDATGKEYKAGEPEEVTIEENGPVRAVVMVRGHHKADDSAELFEYIVRLIFYRNQGYVRILHTFGNDNTGQPMTDIKRMGIRFPLNLSEAAGRAIWGKFDQPDGQPGFGGIGYNSGQDAVARQMYHDRFVLTDSDSERKGTELEGCFVTDGDLWGELDLMDLSRQYPKGIALEGNVIDIQLCPELKGDEYKDVDAVTSDRLYYYMRDGVYRFSRGVTKTHEILLAFGRREGDTQTGIFAAKYHHAAEGPHYAASPEWYAQSGAAGLMTARSGDEFSEYEALVEGNFAAFEKLRERQAEYGMLNFGDYWGERGYNWGNIEYDTQHVMLMEYLRTQDPKFLVRGCQAAVHNRDVDGIHSGPSPRDVGKVHVHCMFHTGGYEVTGEQGIAMPNGGFNRGHVWTRGLFDHYAITGDRRSRDWAIAVADQIAERMTIGFSVGNHAERDTAWPIFAVMAAYEFTADPYYLNAAKLMIEDVIRRQIPETGNWGFPAGYSKADPQPIGGYAWCCGLLITALNQYNNYAADPRVDEVITRAAKWLVRDEWIEDKQGFRATSCPTFDASTPAGGACWSCANAMLIAHELTGEDQFLDIARRGFSLFIKSTSAAGKSVTQSICLGPETLWRFRQLGITSLDPAEYLPQGKVEIPRHYVVSPGEAFQLPVTVRNDRAASMKVQLLIDSGSGSATEVTAEIAPNSQSPIPGVHVPDAENLKPGDKRDITVSWTLGEAKGKQTMTLHCPAAATVGEELGLATSGEDFLGPALDELGVKYRRLTSLEELANCRAVMLGTQAHSIDTLGLKDDHWRLWPWVHAGGVLMCSQLNDTGWSRYFLPQELAVEEPDSEAGEIVSRDHPIFSRPKAIDSASGVKMYDTLSIPPGASWQVLLRDSKGGPAIVETQYGEGRVIVMQPSFERLVTEAGLGAHESQLGRDILGNILAYAMGGE